MSHRKALTRHTQRANPAGIPAAHLIAQLTGVPVRPEPAREHATSPLFLPGLRPALTTGAPA